ncbi:hypothetical protein [Mycobacteroides abscessus]|uniref:hypothetical protein n=1 Tax=Mycobacteroides abscessus TaxID=36809 RepID=UPI0020C42370|nr:hypothetical protein [Mycobacteroides abscessus]
MRPSHRPYRRVNPGRRGFPNSHTRDDLAQQLSAVAVGVNCSLRSTILLETVDVLVYEIDDLGIQRNVPGTGSASPLQSLHEGIFRCLAMLVSIRASALDNPRNPVRISESAASQPDFPTKRLAGDLAVLADPQGWPTRHQRAI